jgi:O-antigen/teichoic acid export membrane protein
VWAVAAVFAAIASMFRDFGVAEYLIQEKDLTRDKLRAALGVNIAVSWAMAALLFLGSGLVARFYAEPGVGDVMRVQALNFVLIPFGAVTLACFRRDLHWPPIFYASILSNVTSVTVAVVLAFLGHGYMSLAWSSVSGVAMSVAVATIARPKDVPLLPGIRGVRRVIRFGTHLTSVYLLGQLGKSAPDLVIGKVLGVAPVGFFSRANGLGELFNRLVLKGAFPVCLPYFAREAREGKDVRTGYLRAVAYLTVIGWPSFLFLAAMAYPAIRILYGPQWLASVPLARILCGAAAVSVVYLLATEVLIARGDAAIANYVQAVTQVARIAGIVFVVPFGLDGACWGLFGAAFFGAFAAQRALRLRIGLTLAKTAAACAPSAIVALVSAAPAVLYALFGVIDERNFAYVAVGLGVTFGILWLVSVRLVGHPLWNEICAFVARRRTQEQQA